MSTAPIDAAAAPSRRARRRDPVRRRARLRRRAARPLRARAARSCSPPAASATRAAHGGTLDFLDRDARRSARATGRSRRRVADYADRRVEITGPTDRKLVINALNSGAKGFMADFEDANSPTWRNQVDGHVNLIDAIDGTITYDALRRPRTTSSTTTPRRCSCARAAGTCPRSTCTLDGEPVAGALVDFGLYVFHNAQRLLDARLGARTSTCRRWSTTSRRGCGTTCSTFAEERARPAARHDPRDGADRDAARPRSRWTRSSTSCATTPTG